MTPRLVLLTGPAAGEVAQVLRDETGQDDRDMLPSPIRWWDEVRDYLDAPLAIRDAFMDYSQTVCRHEEAGDIEAAIRSLPGGEAWLVGLVLPDQQRPRGPLPVYHKPHWMDQQPESRKALVANVLERHGLPPCLAILAPEPPPLLVERVRQWGGERWECAAASDFETGAPVCCIWSMHWDRFETDKFLSGKVPTWPEAVRAALGEVAP